jgi:uncharacterized protein YidB (DUF937 family)
MVQQFSIAELEVVMGMFDLQGGGRRVVGMSPIQMGVLGLLAYKALKGKGGLAGIFGSDKSPGVAGAAPSGGPLSGGVLGGGLKDLLDRFRQSGQEDKAQSWVAKGANKPIAPQELEQTLGEERIQWLMEQTGLPREELLSGLSRELPDAVDELTPDGRVPTDEELSRRPS